MEGVESIGGQCIIFSAECTFSSKNSKKILLVRLRVHGEHKHSA
jgi:hypothetical protein